MASHAPIRLAIIGAGIFAREGHVPALNALKESFEVVAVSSRTEESARRVADLVEGNPDVYTDAAQVLARKDIEAVDLILPIDIMPRMVEQALDAGKHVVSEKPAVPDVATGRALLAKQTDRVWSVAENFRYEDALLEAAQVLQSGEIGRPVLFHWDFFNNMTPKNPYYHTPWRFEGRFSGGYIIDGGVHVAAGLRLVFGEVEEVSAIMTQERTDLPPPDTMSSSLRFESGLVGGWNMTYAVPAPWPHTLYIAGENGSISAHLGRVEVTSPERQYSRDIASASIKAELQDFALAIREGKAHRNAADQAVQDVAVLEALLKAADTGCRVRVERVVR